MQTSKKTALGAALLACALGFFHQAQAQTPPPAGKWERLEDCRLIPNQFNDGDSFHVRAGGKEYIFRLYFVDTPEAEANYAERTDQQAEYFGISEDAAVKLGKDAAAFTSKRLAGTFTVFTRWKDALGRSKQKRFYAVVMVGREDLAELLVRNGLARIYGVRTPLPDGRDSRAYLGRLTELEAQAKRTKLGGWNKKAGSLAGRPAPVAVPSGLGGR